MICGSLFHGSSLNFLLNGCSRFEPELSAERLQVIDDFADMVEIQRLFGVSVLCKHGDYEGQLGTQLSAKFVRT